MSPEAPPPASEDGGAASSSPGQGDLVDSSSVRTLAGMLGLSIASVESDEVESALRSYLRYGGLLQQSPMTNVLPSDDPRWCKA
jgi:hypothetical protein